MNRTKAPAKRHQLLPLSLIRLHKSSRPIILAILTLKNEYNLPQTRKATQEFQHVQQYLLRPVIGTNRQTSQKTRIQNLKSHEDE